MFTLDLIAFVPVQSEQQQLGGAQALHTLNIVPARLAERVWCTKIQSSLLNIYFRLCGFQFSLLLIYFRDAPKRCSQHPK